MRVGALSEINGKVGLAFFDGNFSVNNSHFDDYASSACFVWLPREKLRELRDKIDQHLQGEGRQDASDGRKPGVALGVSEEGRREKSGSSTTS
jgi:hypothetical protein